MRVSIHRRAMKGHVVVTEMHDAEPMYLAAAVKKPAREPALTWRAPLLWTHFTVRDKDFRCHNVGDKAQHQIIY